MNQLHEVEWVLVKENNRQLFHRLFISYLYTMAFLIAVDILSFDFEINTFINI